MVYKNSARALRRQQRVRLYVKRAQQRQKIWGKLWSSLSWHEQRRQVNRAVTTPAACACWMCENPRRQGLLTLCETAALQQDRERRRSDRNDEG